MSTRSHSPSVCKTSLVSASTASTVWPRTMRMSLSETNTSQHHSSKELYETSHPNLCNLTMFVIVFITHQSVCRIQKSRSSFGRQRGRCKYLNCRSSPLWPVYHHIHDHGCLSRRRQWRGTGPRPCCNVIRMYWLHTQNQIWTDRNTHI